MSALILFFSALLLLCPVIAVVINLFGRARPALVARCAGYFIGLAFLCSIVLLVYLVKSQQPVTFMWVRLDTLNVLLCSLVLLVGFIVNRFSLRYMDGDALYKRFFLLLSTLALSLLIAIVADNLFIFWGGWFVSNSVLVLLMIHKQQWNAAKQSGLLAFYTLASGSCCLLIATIILSQSFATSSIAALTQQIDGADSCAIPLAMGLILVAALTQSGLFPFHRWLISSLNSPTSVSALMHAGLINGGGILVVKFAPIMVLYPAFMAVLFVLGAVSVFLGTVWKLMQHDIKKMLACSTMAQMGFMMMQCGVGLFAAAIAHVCLHGLFKSYLFLSSGSAITQKKSEIKISIASPVLLLIALSGGLAAMSSFAFITNKTMLLFDANSFVLFFALIAGAQLMLTWVHSQKSLLGLLTGLSLATLSGLMYGASVHFFEWLLPDISALQAPRLSAFHWALMSLFGVLWLVFNSGVHSKWTQSRLGCWCYMSLFNASQPSPKTITALRTDYNY